MTPRASLLMTVAVACLSAAPAMAQIDPNSPFIGGAPVPALTTPATNKDKKPHGIQADPGAPPVPANLDPTDTLAAMISAAYRSGDDATINAVIGVAKSTFPDRAAEIDRLAAGDAAILAKARKDESEKQQARIASARFFEIWKGELEAGASRSTGSTRQLGLYASAKLNREGLNWIQKFSTRLDYQQTDNETTTERFIATYQPDYKIDDKLYVYGLAQYEHDRFLGYDHRFTGGTGVGYTIANSANLKLQVEGGPAVRRTDYIDLNNRTSLAGRAAMSARIAITPTLAFSQDASLFFEARDTTASATTSLDTKLIGALKARFSYNVQFEQNAPEGGHELDTISRATLVYSF